jgi:CheY-like chemotaxis protein
MTQEKLKILCVEDEVDIRENIAEILDDCGYEVFEADNGKSGFDKFLQVNPDLVISDIKMPEMDGYNFLKLVRQNRNVRNNATPFIFLSALGGKEDVLRGVELSANDYLLKPIDFELLMAKVKEKVSNVNRTKINHQKAIDNLKRQVSVVLPSDIFSYLDVVTQTAKSLQDEPYGALPHRGYQIDFNKIYINSLKIRALIYNALDHDIIDEKLNASENIFDCYELLEDFISNLSDKIRQRIFIQKNEIQDSASVKLPKIKCDNLVIFEALRKILSQMLKVSNDANVQINLIDDHRGQIAIIFYVIFNENTSENVDLNNFIDEGEISRILDKQSIRFEIDLKHNDSAILTIPKHRVIAN